MNPVMQLNYAISSAEFTEAELRDLERIAGSQLNSGERQQLQHCIERACSTAKFLRGLHTKIGAGAAVGPVNYIDSVERSPDGRTITMKGHTYPVV